MSQGGDIIFYTEEHFANPEEMLFRIFAWLDAKTAFIVHRTLSEGQEWKLTLAAQEDDNVHPYDRTEDLFPGVWTKKIADLRGAYKPGRVLIIDLSTSPRTSFFCSSHAELNPAIRGDFNPGSPIILLGHHDLFEEDGEGELHYIARSFCSIKIFGYGTPANDAVYREIIWKQSFVQDFEMEILKLFAPHPVKHAVTFSY